MCELPLKMSYKIGQIIHVRDKAVDGKIAYIGGTDFAPGVWVGIILDEAKGKNNGSVQGKSYFECSDKHGMFVRQSQLSQIADVKALAPEAMVASPAAPARSPSESGLKKPGIPTPGASSGAAKSRLPTPGSGPTGGRSPSFTNLKLKERNPMQSQSQGLTRERSFIETNFVETLKQPQIQVQTPVSQRIMGSSSASATPSLAAASGSSGSSAAAAISSPSVLATQKMAERLEEKAANLAQSQELSKAKDEIIDLKEKLETLKLKRARDQEKIKEFEKLRIQYEQLLEFKTKIMESQALLQKELQKAKHEAKEAIEAKEAHAEEMAELSETVEMITLDKEMAEERAETLTIELEAAKEKVEELTLDLDIIKTEMEGGGGHEGSNDQEVVTHFEVKQLQAQNEKLRETLVRMRDLSAHEKSESIKVAKEVEELRNQNGELSKSNDKFKADKKTLA